MDKETQKIKDVVMVHKNEKTDGREQAVLFPMNKWRLYSDFKNGKGRRWSHTIYLVVFNHWCVCIDACLYQFYESFNGS
jgi:hypothetical protein